MADPKTFTVLYGVRTRTRAAQDASSFGFEGLQFDDEGRAREFLTPLQKRGVREVKLKGLASGQPVTIKLTPTP
jgi:hypothetical protein